VVGTRLSPDNCQSPVCLPGYVPHREPLTRPSLVCANKRGRLPSCKWSIYGGGGDWLNPGDGNKNFWYVGLVTQYQLTEKLSLGGEVFQHTSSSIAVPGIIALGSSDTTGFNFGGIYGLYATYHLHLDGLSMPHRLPACSRSIRRFE
jgi:hypothetical protein